MQPPKPRVIKDFEKLEEHLQEQIKLVYPYGFHESLIHFYNKEGKKVTALPFETDEKYYMIRMTVAEAKAIIEDDSDFDDDGNLKEEIKDDYENKYSDVEYVADYLNDDSESGGGGDGGGGGDSDDED
jgi:hypothetical protein